MSNFKHVLNVIGGIAPGADHLLGGGITETIREAGVFDVTGRRTTASWSPSDGDKLVFDLASLPVGTYLVILELADGTRQSYKIARQE